MARPHRSPARWNDDGAGDSVGWRGGVHITDTEIWCDARRARAVCFASCAHAVGGSRHGQVIATAPTLAVLASRARGRGPAQLSSPYGRPFTLGTVRLELIPSGHAPGSASLVLDVGGRRILYAGPVNPAMTPPAADGLVGEPYELRTCDVVVIAAAYGAAASRFPPPGEQAARVVEFAREVTDRGEVAVLLVSSPSKGAQVAARLADEEFAIAAEPSIRRAADALRERYPRIPRLASISTPRASAARTSAARTSAALTSARQTRRSRSPAAPAARVLLWPIARRDALDRVRAAHACRVALVSGLALDPAATGALRVDAAFAWSGHADRDALVRYIDECGARRVFTTHRDAEAFAAAIDRPDRPARALGPPRQMRLFEP